MFSRKILVKKFHGFSRKVVRYGRKASPVKKNKVNAKVLWSELDENLLGEIMSRLSPTDQARFHAVCKRWHSIRPITAYKSLPWFVSLEAHSLIWSHSLKYRLYEPYSSAKSRISTYKFSLSKLGIPYSVLKMYHGTVRHGWLFISVGHINWSCACYTYCFVFSFLTREYILLPKVDHHLIMLSSSFYQTFSTNPNSPDCVFLISNIGEEREFLVMTCRQGDKEWTIRKFENFVLGSCRAEYINGNFFFASSSGRLASYNIMNGKFKIETLDRDDDFCQRFNSQMEFRMFELNGDPTILYLCSGHDRLRGDNNSVPAIPCIKKFDWHTKAWVHLRSLGDQTLFVGPGMYSMVKVGIEQTRNMGVLSNAIYYYFDRGCIIYSFENGVLVQLKYNVASKNTVKSGDLLQLHYNSAIWDKKHSYFLLEPPVIW
ncbi:hypothetical protein POM88_033963 [Heracleum sosnowskyi]|uniref:F-box domain-containing protein n=1 Tax=Heracleum sosnowskyi TaxID=360622 RepID=A0AAD8HJU2_9APIA|nr:hypothetical protein POM88_033963 [Heracleum sosnowskyi]